MITILSQDKGTLIEAKEVDREYEDNTIWADDTMVGKYSTCEKTKKVFDDIIAFKEIMNTIDMMGMELYVEMMHKQGKDNFTIPMVYKMPLDEEVKE